MNNLNRLEEMKLKCEGARVPKALIKRFEGIATRESISRGTPLGEVKIKALDTLYKHWTAGKNLNLISDEQIARWF